MKMIITRRAALALAASAVPALAHSQKHGSIAIGHAWALPSTITDGQMFAPLLNTAETADALVAARSEICTAIELRRNARYDDPAETKFDLLPKKPVAMRPSAMHVRLIGLKQPLVLGQIFPLILDFENAGEVEVQVYVEAQPGE
jgi:periplasmic copper chaperone A